MSKTKPEIPIWSKAGVLIWAEIRDAQDIEVNEYVEGEITEADHDARIVKAKLATGEEKEMKPDRIHERLASHGIVKDLSDIPILNDAELMKHLELRYRKDLIYCFCGPTLIAINPYKKVPNEENDEKRHHIMSCYLEKRLKDVEPHVWAVSAISFDYLFSLGQNQAICISGESGAGKTESTKRCMEFITNMKGERKSLGYVPIEQKIMSCNPILESFGNAKTFRNDNSSRFGKYTVLFVDKTKKNVKGASIENYLLEKSRLVKLGKEERNYHIFYAMCRFMAPEMQKKYLLTNDGDKVNMEKYNYINQTGVYVVGKINDQEFYDDVIKSFTDLDFTEGQQDAIWRMLSTVLQLGNLKIDQENFVEGSKPCLIIKDDHWSKIITLLNINESSLEEALTNKELKIGNNVTKSPLTPAKVQNSIDSLAKEMYNRIFNWIVKKLNKSLLPSNPKDPNFSTIGVLDIFGFEIFEKNSLEQFMINFANERLQSLYIDYIFKNECRIFEEEGLGQYTSNIVYKDNRPLVKCLDNPQLPPGIFDLVDQTCSLNKTDETFHSEVTKAHKTGGHIIFPKFANQLSFIVKHTARDVEYMADGFVEKNKDELSSFLSRAIDTSITDVVEIFNEISGLGITREQIEEKEKATKNPKEKYLGFKFRRNMDDLVNQLAACYCHFIRCIKPNEQKKSEFWNPQLALMQIRYMGLLDSLKVRKMSYPFRYDYKKFFELFQDLDTGPNGAKSFLMLQAEAADFTSLSKDLLKVCEVGFTEKDLLYGRTRIFLNEKFKIDLEKALLVKQKKKKEALKLVSQAYKTFLSKSSILEYFQSAGRSIIMARDLVRSWSSKLTSMKHKNYLRIINKLQANFRKNLAKREAKLRAFNMQNLSKYLALYKFSRLLKYILEEKTKVTMLQAMLEKKLLDAKNRFCRSFVDRAVDGAWEEISRRVLERSVQDVQRTFRSRIARKARGKEVADFFQKMQEAKVYNAAATIQRFVRGYLVRKRIARYNRAASKIQGFVRMVWMKKYLETLKRMVPKIQKAWRRFQIRNIEMKKGMSDYMVGKETINDTISRLEHNILFSDQGAITPQINVNDYTQLPFNIDRKAEYGKSNYKNFMPEPPNIEIAPRAKFVSLLIDLDVNVDTTNIYQNTWAVEFNNFIKRIHAKGSRLLHIEVGESFTLAVTDDREVYTWGLNDFNQCARQGEDSFCLSQNIVKNFCANEVRMVSLGKDHGLFLDNGNNLYSWGKNSDGQLGLGHTRQSSAINCLSYLSKDPIKLISAKEGVNYVVTKEGKVLTWPFANGANTFVPVELPLPQNVKVTSLDVGCDFTMLLTGNGLLYSLGKNKYGELGSGDTTERTRPVLVSALRELNEKIVEISCGFKHTVARSALNRVYVWGYNKAQQLGLGDSSHRKVPTRLDIPEFKGFRFKPRSVQATYNGGYMLLDDRQLYFWGRTGKLSTIAKTPTRLCYEETHFEGRMADDFTPIRVQSKWSKILTATYLIFLDCRNYAESKTLREKFAEKVNAAWAEADRQILPPGDEILAKHIHSKYLEKPLKRFKPNTSFAPAPKPENPVPPSKEIIASSIKPQAQIYNTISKQKASAFDSALQETKISKTEPTPKPKEKQLNLVRNPEKSAKTPKKVPQISPNLATSELLTSKPPTSKILFESSVSKDLKALRLAAGKDKDIEYFSKYLK